MGTTLIFVGQWMVTDLRKLFGLIGLLGPPKRFQEIASTLDRTRNRHRWTGRAYQGA